ncbi:MAG TPA: phosphatase PAP2 family protein [Gemmatimonadales bacterium]|jgi:membrane-associated phospholipid phosphatase|nr:phosphatase PAP2 family protein [Gemmatimonadales bacterium]
MTVRGSFAIAALAFQTTLLPVAATAQIDRVPSAIAPATHSSPLISRRTAMVAGMLFGASLIGDRGLRGEFQEHRGATSNSLARVGNSLGEWQYVVPALSAGLLVGQLSGSDGLKRTMLHTAAAAAIATGVTSALKYSIGRTRPDFAGDPDQFRPFSGANSFPSGHTAVAFAIATSIADETHDKWSDYLLYGAASMTALARVNDDRHWASDVLVGGLIGHLSGRWVSQQMGPVRITPGAVTVNLEF